MAAVNEERQDRILEACAALLLKFGYDKTTVSDIAREAGISKGAIYLHFPAKESIVEALIWREMEYAQQRIGELLAADPEGGSFISLYLHSLRIVSERPLLRAFYGQRRHIFGDSLRLLAPRFANVRAREDSAAFLARYQAHGLLRADVDPAVAAFLLAVVRYGLLMIDEVIDESEFPDRDALFDLLTQVLNRGLGTEGGDRAAGREEFVSYMKRAVEKSKGSLTKPDREDQ